MTGQNLFWCFTRRFVYCLVLFHPKKETKKVEEKWYELWSNNQVIQAVTFLSPNVGGQQTTFERVMFSPFQKGHTELPIRFLVGWEFSPPPKKRKSTKSGGTFPLFWVGCICFVLGLGWYKKRTAVTLEIGDQSSCACFLFALWIFTQFSEGLVTFHSLIRNLTEIRIVWYDSRIAFIGLSSYKPYQAILQSYRTWGGVFQDPLKAFSGGVTPLQIGHTKRWFLVRSDVPLEVRIKWLVNYFTPIYSIYKWVK